MKKANVSNSNSNINNKIENDKNNFLNRFIFFVLTRKDWFLLLIIFIICFITLFAQQIFIRKLGIFDEVTYYNMAKNIFYEGDFRFYGLRTFPLIIYPLLISPFFAIKDSLLRLQVIYIFNSFLFASSLFPTWLISKELGITRKFRYIILLFAILLPIMSFSYVIMAEAIYYPLVLWIVLLALYNSKRNKWYLSILLGALFYLSFITKKIGAIFFVSYLIMSLIMPIIYKFFNDNKKKNISQYYDKKSMLNLAVLFVTFFSLYFIFRYTIFNDSSVESVGNILGAIKTFFSSFTNFAYIIYWIILFLISFIASIFLFPFIYPLVYFKHLNNKCKEIFVFAIIYLIILSFYVSSTITFAEEPYELLPNIHLRYTIPMHVLIIIVFVSLSDHKKNILINENKKKYLLTFSAFALLTILLFKGNRFMYVDANFLCIYTSYKNLIFSTLSNLDNYLLYLILVVTNIFIVGLIFAFDQLLISKRKCVSSVLLLTGFSLITLTVGTYNYRLSNSVSINEISEIQKIDKFLCSQPDSNVLCLVNNGGWSCFVIEPYINKSDKLFIIENADYFKNSMNISSTGLIKNEVNNIEFSPLHAIKSISLTKVDYILLPKETMLSNFIFENVELIPNFDGEYYQLLRNIDNCYITIYAE